MKKPHEIKHHCITKVDESHFFKLVEDWEAAPAMGIAPKTTAFVNVDYGRLLIKANDSYWYIEFFEDDNDLTDCLANLAIMTPEEVLYSGMDIQKTYLSWKQAFDHHQDSNHLTL